jgi:penicillin-binding protein 2
MAKVITPSTSVLSSGGIHVGEWFFPDWKFGGHGITNVTKAIAQSVNTFFYAIGGGWDAIQGLGIDRLDQYFRLFGLGSKLGIDLPSEATGFVPSAGWKQRVKDEPWYIGDTYHVSIGQGDLTVTPLQAAVWTAIFANGGDLIRPHLVKQARSSTKVQQFNPPPITRQLVPKDIVGVVRNGMRETILSGSARGLQVSPWTIAGKTGTAQWGNGETTHAWFTGFAPYDDPRIAVVVLVEAGGEGTAAAAPVARDIMEAWLRAQGVKPDNGSYKTAPVVSASSTVQTAPVVSTP